MFIVLPSNCFRAISNKIKSQVLHSMGWFLRKLFYKTPYQEDLFCCLRWLSMECMWTLWLGWLQPRQKRKYEAQLIPPFWGRRKPVGNPSETPGVGPRMRAIWGTGVGNPSETPRKDFYMFGLPQPFGVSSTHRVLGPCLQTRLYSRHFVMECHDVMGHA